MVGEQGQSSSKGELTLGFRLLQIPKNWDILAKGKDERIGKRKSESQKNGETRTGNAELMQLTGMSHRNQFNLIKNGTSSLEVSLNILRRSVASKHGIRGRPGKEGKREGQCFCVTEMIPFNQHSIEVKTREAEGNEPDGKGEQCQETRG